jgi:hypothetical protein
MLQVKKSNFFSFFSEKREVISNANKENKNGRKKERKNIKADRNKNLLRNRKSTKEAKQNS